MPSPAIFNSLASPDLDIIEMTDPGLIQFYATSLANQVNAFRMGYSPQKRVIDLADWISDILIETTAQGGSLLQVTVIDPTWVMFTRDKNGVCFIDVDDSGYLWPPVEVNFPPDISSATWRLCQCIPTTDLSQANVTLTFEDKIVSELREHYGAQTSYPDQTRAEFIQSLVQQANANPEFATESTFPIRFVPLLPKETFTTADLSLSQQLPASATQVFAPASRKNPNKNPAVPSPSSLNPEQVVQPTPLSPSAIAAGGTDISIQDGLANFQGGAPAPFYPFAPPPASLRPGIG